MTRKEMWEGSEFKKQTKMETDADDIDIMLWGNVSESEQDSKAWEFLYVCVCVCLCEA